MIYSSSYRAQQKSATLLGASLVLACTPDPGGECTPSSAAEQIITGTSDTICIVSLVEQDPTDDRRWTIATACGQEGFSAELTLDPPLEDMPLEVGEEVTSSVFTHSPDDGHVVELFVDGQLRLVMVDTRLPEADAPAVEEPLFPPGLFEFEWSVVPGCADDPQCGVVEQRQVEASVAVVLEPEVSTLGPEQPYSEISGGDYRFGVWLGPNWVSECNGEATARVSYVIAALPLP